MTDGFAQPDCWASSSAGRHTSDARCARRSALHQTICLLWRRSSIWRNGSPFRSEGAMRRRCFIRSLRSRYGAPVHFAARYQAPHLAEAWSPSHQTDPQVSDAEVSAPRRHRPQTKPLVSQADPFAPRRSRWPPPLLNEAPGFPGRPIRDARSAEWALMSALSPTQNVRGHGFQMHHYRGCAGDPLSRGLLAAFFAYLSLRRQRK